MKETNEKDDVMAGYGDKASWDEIRQNGLLHFVNEFLQLFGYTIVIDPQEDGTYLVNPQKTTFTGFSEESNEQAYQRVSKFMAENGTRLLEEKTNG